MGWLGDYARAKSTEVDMAYETTTRGTGLTTRQMVTAPMCAIFVWCNNATFYPKELAKKLKREDIKVVSPYWLTSEQVRGLRPTAVILDHACRLTRDQDLEYRYLLQYSSATKGPK